MSGEHPSRILAIALACLLTIACGETPPDAVDAGGGDAGACSGASECDDGLFCNGAETCASSACGAGVSPCMPTQTCDEATDACVTECATEADADGDGEEAVACGGDDCDDADPDAFPGNVEICDAAEHDEDCDPATYGDRDLDGDGLDDAQCCNGSTCGMDCNDLVRGVSPGSPEVCNGFDDDCDGSIDEGVRVTAWPDRDFDLHGDADATPEMQCAGAHGFATVGDDCDDVRPQVHTAQVEICDAIDNDCDGTVDEAPAATTWYADGDDDGFGDPDVTRARVSCTPLPGYSLRPTDCNDAANGISPAATEQCNGIDDDCNGAPDFMISPGNSEDDDLDGQADAMCPAGGDCDDRDPTTRAGAPELCDRRDNDCDTTIDEESAMGIWYRDADGDTFGDGAQPTVMSCTFVAGYIPRSGDCDDSTPARRPFAAEPCNGVDDDCDGDIDEGADRGAYYLDADLDGLGAGVPVLACAMPADRVALPGDCDDGVAAIGGPSAWRPDRDGDGSGDRSAAAVLACSAPLDHVGNTDDCDDEDVLIEVGAPERCNAADDDCDGAVDDGASSTCALANATSSCTAGACAIDACSASYDDCDAMDATGCEQSVGTDRLNCGGCGVVCPMGAACRAGECAGVAQIVGGQDFMCARLTDGSVSCWGGDSYGQLGRGATAASRLPGLVQTYLGLTLDDATMISAHPAGNHVCALRADRTVWCWGQNTDLQCGADGGTNALRAYPVPGLTAVIHVDAGDTHTCAVVEGGGVRCWGGNDRGQLGSGAIGADVGTPVAMMENEGGTRAIADAVQVSAGSFFTCVLHAGGARVSCAGLEGSGGGWAGQLGRGSITSGNYPIADDVTLPAGGAALTGLSSGWGHTCALRGTGRPVCWGICTAGQCTGCTTCSRSVATEVDLLLASTSEIETGYDSTCFRYQHPSLGERVACSGNDGSGQLGDGIGGGSDIALDPIVTAADRSTQLALSGAMALGSDFACVTLADGAVTCWGQNRSNVYGGAGTSRSFANPAAPVPGVP